MWSTIFYEWQNSNGFFAFYLSFNYNILYFYVINYKRMRKKIIILGSIFIVLFLILWLFVFKVKNKTINEDNEITHKNVVVDREEQDDNQIKDKKLEENDEIIDKKDKKRLENNAKILAQIQDEDFWNKKIEEIIDKNLYGEKWEIKILWYWLLCEQWKEYQQDLSNCEYTVWFSNKVENWHWWNTLYDVYLNGSFGGSIWWFDYGMASIAIAMNDIWNWGIFYNDRYSTGTNLKVNNDDWTATYYLYKIDGDSWEILNKSSENIISRNTAREIIANNAWIDKKVVDPILRIWEWIYEREFSYKWHTYDYVINAKDWTIIKGWDEIDIWDDEARNIAMKDAWITRGDLSHWNWDMWWLDEPNIKKIWTGNSAIYRVVITTNKDKYYLYDISAIDGKIISSKFSEKFVIHNKNWKSKDLTFKIESVFPKKQNLDVKIHEFKMDDIYEFKDLIYLWITFEDDKIVDWSIIDKDSDKNLGKMTKKELDELYNFESHYKIEEITGTKTINLSKLKENVIYKFSKKWNNWTSWSYPKVVNDLWVDVVVYENIDYEHKHVENWVSSNRPRIYKKSAIVYDKYPYSDEQNYYSNSTVDRSTYYIMYKKANKSDLLKALNDEGITYLSKYEIWEEIKRWYDENYLYNDTNKSITVFITDEIAKERDNIEDMKTTIKPWNFIFCSEYVDSITIIN